MHVTVYKSIVSTINFKKNRQKCKSMFLCGHAPWCGACLHTECGHACVFLNKITSPGHLAIRVNNVIIMCIGLVQYIFTRKGVYMKIDN